MPPMTDQYHRFFEAGECYYLLESLYVHAYRDLNCVTIRHGRNVTFLFDNPHLENCQEEGIALLASSTRFEEFEVQFRRFLRTGPELCELAVGKRDHESLARIFVRLLEFYRWTESFYTNRAYEWRQTLPIPRERLVGLESLKTSGRTFLNALANSPQGYFFQFARANPKRDFLSSSFADLIARSPRPYPKLRGEDHLLAGTETLYSSETRYYKAVLAWLESGLEGSGSNISGRGASRGVAQGTAWVLSANADTHADLESHLAAIPDGVILVTETTSPDLVSACFKARGIVTNQGGLGSHAAVISRELGIPCVVGTGNATHRISTGDCVRMDGETGDVWVESRGRLSDGVRHG